MIWFNKDAAYKVKIVKYDYIFYLRIIYFFYDLFYIINEIKFLKDFKKIKVWWIFPYAFQITKLLILVVINVMVLLDKDVCISSRNDKNIFYFENKFNKILFYLFLM